MSAILQKGNSLSGRSVAIAVTVAVHAALISGLLAMKVAQVVAERSSPISVSLIEERRPAIPEPRAAAPDLETVETLATPEPETLQIPVEEVAVLPQPDPGAITAETSTVDSGASLAVDTPIRYQATRPSDDYYPPQAIRMQAQGATIIRTCVGADGRLSSSPTVVRSSREPLLDAAAVKWASEALRFQPATRGGMAVASCKDFRVSFTLR